MRELGKFFQKPIFKSKKFIYSLWFLLAGLAAFKHAFRGVFNDYYIFKSTFYHTLEQVNLYLQYPELNGDSNHYGPIFGVLFAPFALLPDSVGTILWEFAMAAVLLFAIRSLPIIWNAKVAIFYICLQALHANGVNSETNTLIAALIIGAFVCIRSEKDFWAACFIMLGTFIKLYGIVGLAFFFFSKHKGKFITYLFLWSIVFFILPMLISSPSFVIQSYVDWYDSLVEKNMLNAVSINQDISVMGMARRITGNPDLSNLVFLIPAVCLFALQYIQIKHYENLKYQLLILASTLLCVVLFSSGTEHCTFIIAVSGMGIWFVVQEKPCKGFAIYLVFFALIMSFLASGLTPSFIRKGIVKAFALEALPFLIIWLTLIYQVITFHKQKIRGNTHFFKETSNEK